MASLHTPLETADPAIRSVVARVRETGEPLFLDEDGEPVAVLVGGAGLRQLQWILEGRPAFIARAAELSKANPELAELTDDEIVARVKATRRELMRELYGER